VIWTSRVTKCVEGPCSERVIGAGAPAGGDTSPLPGLAYGNSPFAYANAFVRSGLRCFCAQRGGIRFAYANLLIPWVAKSFARFSKP
jgi:hypothetical protein